MLARKAEDYLERRILPTYLPSGASVLDLGCGTAVNLKRLIRLDLQFKRYVGVDLTPEMVCRGRSKFANMEKATFCQGDMCHLPFSPNRFDFALCTWALEHVPRVKQAITETLMVLKEGAYLVLVFSSPPRHPLRILALLLAPALRIAFQVRFLRPADYAGVGMLVSQREFAIGSQTVVLLRKDK